ncbi:hypothetical protein OG422_16030 [Streptomyces sp. NBC_01525]|uniref:hypothetical protein n=1 Tax=Streptomyces sp. NBC_01525 TaxID=2903893 RepID=UPI003868CB1F
MTRTPMPRLLPWTGENGQPCHLSADDDASFMWRLADDTEAVQLGMAAGAVEHAHEVLSVEQASREELHYLAGCLVEALTNVLRIADSRGQRLGWPTPAGEGEAGGEEGEGPTLPADAFG